MLIIDDRCVEFESRLERKAILVVRARTDTLKVVEQSPRVEFVDGDGVLREHVFDLLVTASHRKIAIDVKPAAKVKSSGIRDLHRIIAPQMPPGIADELLVMTEKKFKRADLYNAELIHAAFRQNYPKDDEAVLRLIGRMKGPASIADLVARSKLHGYGFNAIVRAIGSGRLRMVGRKMIDYDALVAPADGER